MPAKFRIDARITFVSMEGLAYSFRYTAQATPNGTAKTVVINVNKIVPTMAGNIPPFVIPFVGYSYMKFHDKAGKPFEKISHKIIPKKAHTISVLPIRISQLNVCDNFFFTDDNFLNGWQNIHPIN